MERFDPDLVDQFEEIVESDEDALSQLWQHVAPSMAKRKRARKAALIVCASSSDQQGMRGRCHLLMHGPPGTGKTVLRNWVRNTIRHSIGIGPKSSEAGLKGDARGDELTPGALERSHGGVLCIDELDEFSLGDRKSLLESMSEGEYEVDQGEIHRIIKAETRVIATCNRLDAFRPELRDRFDFLVEMPEYDESETVKITDELTENFVDAFIHGERVSDSNLVAQYLRWIEDYQPGAGDGLKPELKRMKNYLITKAGMTGSIRAKQMWNRVAYTIAKLNRRDMTSGDFIEAVDLIYPDKELREPLQLAREEQYEELATRNFDH